MDTGIRDLKEHPSEHLERGANGEVIPAGGCGARWIVLEPSGSGVAPGVG